MDELWHAYRRYYPLIERKCRRVLSQSLAAEDIAQETFVRFWRASLRGNDEVTVLAWLYRTSTRLALNYLRDNRRLQTLGDTDVALPPELDEAALSARRTLAHLAQSFPEDELTAVTLTRIDGLGQDEAAAVMQISGRTIRRLLAKFDERAGRFVHE